MDEITGSTGFKVCAICYNNVMDAAHFCSKCGYPVNGTQDEKDKFDADYANNRAELETALDGAKKASTTLYVLAGLTFVVNIIIYGINGGIESLIVALALPLIFVGLAYWSKTKPFTALVIAIVFYTTIILADAFADPTTIYKGIILKIIIIGYLVRGVKSGREAQRIMKELEIKNWNQ